MLLRCQKEPFLQQLTANIISCNEVKKGKKKHYEVVLDDTVLFAEGGGQPSDYGTLKLVPSQDTLPQQTFTVKDVQRKEGKAVHTTDKPVPVGSTVEVVVDWKRRYDHMQQHTGQHLLSAIAEQEPYNFNTVSWNLGGTVSHVELSAPTLTDEIKFEIELKVNRLIQAGLPVLTKVFTSKDDEGLSSAHTRGLPADHTGPIRVVEIEGVDENMCCGTHLSSLSQRKEGHHTMFDITPVMDPADSEFNSGRNDVVTEIQVIKLLHTESKRGNTLLYFVCGDRVISTLQSALDVQQKLNVLLSCPPDAFPSMVDKLSKDNRTSRKQAEKLSEELAILHAETLKQSRDLVLTVHRPTADTEYSLTLQRELRDACEKRVLLLTMGEQNSAQFVLRGSVEIVDRFGKDVAHKLGGKGGGRDGKFQGKFSDLKNIEDAVQFLLENIKL